MRKRFAFRAFRLPTVVLLVFAAIPLVRNVEAQFEGRLIKEVRVTGNRLVSDQQVLSHVETRPGEHLDKGAIQRDIKRIFKLGYFKTILVDVTEVEDGLVVSYIVSEKSLVNRIHVIGNTKIKERDIKDVISIRIGDGYDSAALSKDAEAILKLYQEKGFPKAEVHIDVEEVGPSKVSVTYNIREGKKARIRRIIIAGNTVFTDRAIRKRMGTRTAKLWLIGGIYDDERFQEDLERITAMYEDEGYVEVEVASTSFEYSPNGKGMFISIAVDEGPQYHVGSVRIQGNEIFADEEIAELVTLKERGVFSPLRANLDAGTISRFYADAGYIYGRAVPGFTLDKEQKLGHVLYTIREGDLIYLGQIEITNNVKTKDEVLRKELTIFPGERFDGPKLRRSQEKLKRLRFFDDERPFELSTRRSAIEGAEDLLINVNEKETGAFYFGVGYSSVDEVLGGVSMELWNFDIGNPPKFTGAGQDLELSLQTGTYRDLYLLRFTDPYFMGYPLTFGAEVFKETRDGYEQNEEFSQDQIGGALSLGKRISEYVSTSAALRYEEVDIHDIGDDVSEEIREEEGSRSALSVIWTLKRDSLDNAIDPTKGSVHSGSIELAGAGLVAETDFVKLKHEYVKYFPLSKKWVFSAHERADYVTEYGRSDRVPIFERFFCGGSASVRGYDERDIGPKSDDVFEDPIGGNVRFVANLEISYAVTDILRAYFFTDGGTAWPDIDEIDISELKLSAGLGFGIKTPIGPIRIDYGVPVNPDSDQGSGRFHFRVGFGRFFF